MPALRSLGYLPALAVSLGACAASPVTAPPAQLQGEVLACPDSRLSLELEPEAPGVRWQGTRFALRLPAGDYQLRLLQDGRRRHFQMLSLEAGERRDLGRIDLQAEWVCPAIYEPVCGADGRRYPNACEAARACVAVVDDAACPATP